MASALLLAGLAATRRRARLAVDELSIKLQQQPWTGDLDGMIARRYIRVLVPYSRTLYFVDLGGTQRGMSYDFMRAFEDDFNAGSGAAICASMWCSFRYRARSCCRCCWPAKAISPPPT